MRYTKEVRKTESDLKKRSHKISGVLMKRKTTNLVIVLLSFLIAALIALAVFMTWFTKEQTAFLEKSLRDVKNEHSVQDSSDTADTSDHIVSSSCHHFLFVGDSRTVGMEEAMQDSDDADTCSYIGKVGEGYYWLVNEGIDQLRTSLSKRARCYCCV